MVEHHDQHQCSLGKIERWVARGFCVRWRHFPTLPDIFNCITKINNLEFGIWLDDVSQVGRQLLRKYDGSLFVQMHSVALKRTSIEFSVGDGNQHGDTEFLSSLENGFRSTLVGGGYHQNKLCPVLTTQFTDFRQPGFRKRTQVIFG